MFEKKGNVSGQVVVCVGQKVTSLKTMFVVVTKELAASDIFCTEVYYGVIMPE